MPDEKEKEVVQEEEVKNDENDTPSTETTEENPEEPGTEDQTEETSEVAPQDNPESQEEEIEKQVNEAAEDSRINEIVASNQLILGKLDALEQLLNKLLLEKKIEEKKPVEVASATKRHGFFDLN
jgi:hypothetical protein